jgi:Zn finger protein HypA/HybF involved in hydrogenase expression
MHELSIAIEVCRQAEKRLGARESRRLRKVAVAVGDDAGVEAANLAFCLDALLGQPPFGGATAHIDRCSGDVLRVDYYEVDDGDSND